MPIEDWRLNIDPSVGFATFVATNDNRATNTNCQSSQTRCESSGSGGFDSDGTGFEQHPEHFRGMSGFWQPHAI